MSYEELRVAAIAEIPLLQQRLDIAYALAERADNLSRRLALQTFCVRLSDLISASLRLPEW